MEMDGLQDHERRHLTLLRKLAPECAVLLKKRGDFPLSEPGDIAVYGAGARRTLKGGTGSGDVNSRFYVTVEQGLEEQGFRVTSKAWLRGFDETGSADGLALDGAGDTALYVLSRTSGEGWDRADVPGDYRLTEGEVRDILACREKYRRFMLVLNVCGPVDLSPVLDVDNILLLSQLGAVTGRVLTDILLGNAVPSGKLASTWVRSEDICRVGDFGTPDNVRYREGVYVGYRYYDAAGVTPLYPFGYGLSYTDFTLGAVKTTLTGGEARVSVPVFNAGRFPGRETVQVYVSAPWGTLDRPRKELAGYAKTRLLSPGEAQRVEVSFPMTRLAGFDEKTSSYLLEKGEYLIYAGTDSAHVQPVAAVELPETLTVRKVEDIGGKPDFADWRPEKPDRPPVPAEVPRLVYTGEDLAETPAPEAVTPSREAMSRAMRLSDDELIALCMGAFRPDSKKAGVIGSAGFTVAGAAGETYGKLSDIPPLVMADGPAGLRLAKYFIREKGVAREVASPAPQPEKRTAGERLKRLLRPEKMSYTPVADQFCTAVPIGTALAQSFDPALLERVGRLIGEEMALFGVDLWLAPALNIHRSPLCGRNFEYYSEDPLVSGLTAAAVTKGVQSVPGRGVTVKHFCCNSQETDRYISNSQVSQRALREIYIRGFEICIREADPAAVMTSYNLLNGVHTSERADLSEGLLRREWGWRGLIMTDWVVAGAAGKGRYRTARAADSIAAGNLFMPGSPADWRAARKALEDGVLHGRKARLTAAFVIDAARRLKTPNKA